MLTELVVRNLGIIDELSLVFGAGMTVVTGETGAGKTLVVSAIDLLTGGRADASLVRPGADQADIQGRFVVGDTETVVRRVIPRGGRSRVYVNDHMSTVAALSERAGELVDLHGQHSHQSLLKGSVQCALLDRFGGVDDSELAALLAELKLVNKEFSNLGGDVRARTREIDLLRHQLAEIEAAAIEDQDEDARLDAEETLLADAGAARQAAESAVARLDADGPAAKSVATVIDVLQGWSVFTDLVARLHDVVAELSDVVAEIRHRGESIDEDPERLELLRTRRAQLSGLRRKYGETLQEVVAFGADTAERLTELEGYDHKAAALDAKRSHLFAKLTKERASLLAARTNAAPRFAHEVERKLRNLAMPDARLKVRVLGESGSDVAFELAANPGHEPRPLNRVASGGELARTMLALRMVLTAGPPTLVFDEVDAGIGGEVARTVGASLAALADRHQIMVVTHLAQVAAFADHHVTVTKDGTNTAVSVARLLDEDARLVELSRMLSGSPDSMAARDHATELVNAARVLRRLPGSGLVPGGH